MHLYIMAQCCEGFWFLGEFLVLQFIINSSSNYSQMALQVVFFTQHWFYFKNPEFFNKQKICYARFQSSDILRRPQTFDKISQFFFKVKMWEFFSNFLTSHNIRTLFCLNYCYCCEIFFSSDL